MRILIYGINFHPEPTGTGKYTGEMARWLASRGHEVRVVTAPPSYPHWRVFSGYSSWKYSRERLHLRDDRKISGVPRAQCPDIEVFRSPIWVPENPKGAKRLFHGASFG
jgi:colanic acid biosynthesis glycosyl transferase WcaI